MNRSHRKVSSLEARGEAIRSAVASARLEGVNLSTATMAVFDDYAYGSIAAAEMMERVLKMYGPGAKPTSFTEQPVR